MPSERPRRAMDPMISDDSATCRRSSGNSSMTMTSLDKLRDSSMPRTPSSLKCCSRRTISAAIAIQTRSACFTSRSVSTPRQFARCARGRSVAPPLKSNPTHERVSGGNLSAQSLRRAATNSDFPEPVRPAIAICGSCDDGSSETGPAESSPTPCAHAARSSQSTGSSRAPHIATIPSQPLV